MTLRSRRTSSNTGRVQASRTNDDAQSLPERSPIAVWLCLVLLLVLTLAVYCRVVGYGFLAWDDGLHVTDNPGLRPVSWQSWADYWRRPYQGLYIPVTYTLYAVEAWLCQGPWSAAPGGPQLSAPLFHAGNLLWHAVNVVLVFLLARQLVGRAAPAAVAAGLFAVHPLVVETVAWVSERKGALCGTFSLVAAWLYFRARGMSEIGEPGGTAMRRQRALFLIAASVAFVLAMLAKPLAAAWPLSIAALELAFYGRWRREGLATLAGWLVVVVVLTMVTKTQQADADSEFVTPPADRPPVAVHAIAQYTGKLLLPVGLIADYGYRPQWLTQQPWFQSLWLLLLGGAALFALSLVIWWWRPELVGLRVLIGVAGAFVAALAPVSGLVPFAFQDISTVADRYAYLALIAPALGVAWVVAHYERPAVLMAAALGILCLAGMSWVQVGHWRNDEALWKHTLAVNKESYVGLRGLGAIYASEGKVKEAIEYLSESFRLHPHASVANNLAWIFATNADPQWRDGPKALEFAKLITAPPHDNNPSTLDTLAAAQAECGQYAEAAKTAERAVELARAAGFTPLADDIAIRVALYRAGKPYRDRPTYVLPGTQ